MHATLFRRAAVWNTNDALSLEPASAVEEAFPLNFLDISWLMSDTAVSCQLYVAKMPLAKGNRAFRDGRLEHKLKL